jgi:hypothetical protein
MIIDVLAFAALGFAVLPCGLFLANLPLYRPLPKADRRPKSALSVLIPARNEEENIEAAVRSILANQGCDFEVIVLDDQSTDRTAEVVKGIAATDGRVRLEPAPPLPAGWCGKQHACYALARLARFPVLVFMDADVRLSPDALRRMEALINSGEIALASGVPRQRVVSWLEQLLIPLIHFILLGFLPIRGMRQSRDPSMSAGCGQLFVARRDAYFQCGGHAMLRDSMHDGIQLPRVFRRASFATDLFDATDAAVCRMYKSASETWRGLGKNATEALASPKLIIPATLGLFLGQVAPVLLLCFAHQLGGSAIIAAALGACAGYIPRLLACARFKQPWSSALLHPLAIVLFLAIQWQAFLRQQYGAPLHWKGRSYAGKPGQPSPTAA